MKKFLCIFALLCIVILSSSCYYRWSGNKKDDTVSVNSTQKISELCIWAECRTQPKNVEEFIPIFAEQVKKYNTFADSLWPNNSVKDIEVIAVTMDKTKAWKISPNWKYSSIVASEVDNYWKVVWYDTEFIFYKKDGKEWVILTINEEALENPETFKKYMHIGTYDLFITYVHEAFHRYEQPEWSLPESIKNIERGEFLEEYGARASRAVIIQQLLNAFIYPKERDSYLKKATATYREYQKNFTEDSLNAQNWDRNEWTAYYIELVSSFKVWYPEIKSINDIYVAYGKVAKNQDVFDKRWVVSEAYILGWLASIFLDVLNQKDWKTEIMKNPTLSPIEILAKYFDDEITSSDIVVVDDALLKKYKEASNQKISLDDENIKAMVSILKEVKTTDINAYNMMVEEFKLTNPDEFEKILKLLEE